MKSTGTSNIVSYNVAKYLEKLGYRGDCKYEYWYETLHRFNDPYKPNEGIIPAPDLLEALNWVAKKSEYYISFQQIGVNVIETIILKPKAIYGDKDAITGIEDSNSFTQAITRALEHLASQG